MAELTESKSGDAKGALKRRCRYRARSAAATCCDHDRWPGGFGQKHSGVCSCQALDYLFLDTGVMYRAVTWAALRRSLDVEDGETVGAGGGTATRCAPAGG